MNNIIEFIKNWGIVFLVIAAAVILFGLLYIAQPEEQKPAQSIGDDLSNCIEVQEGDLLCRLPFPDDGIVCYYYVTGSPLQGSIDCEKMP